MFRNYLPAKAKEVLFGNRRKYGLKPNYEDVDWIKWQDFYLKFYESTQKKGAGEAVNDLGYRSVFSKISLKDKRVLEIGPGSLPHRNFWKDIPTSYTIVDVDKKFIEISKKKTRCETDTYLVKRMGESLPLLDNSFDIILSFYCLEHLLDLDVQLSEYWRLRKVGGVFAGAIPNEGGLAWGMGRYLTSRRWIKKNSDINYDKIICWEHPNFCDDIVNSISVQFGEVKKQFLPFKFITSYDFNLVTAFSAIKMTE